MTIVPDSHNDQSAHPVDVVITWVDGGDPRLAAQREQYLGKDPSSGYSGGNPTYFASNNEIRYCVLSILKFAPFIRNIFIVTDGQDPGLQQDVQNYFPGRADSIKIVDHQEIFRDYEQFLPTFNSTSIETMLWRIPGLSENFVYFNDDLFLLRNIKPEDWFINNRPVLRGKWRLAPFKKLLSNRLKIAWNKIWRRRPDYVPRFSFYLGQWNAASLLGMRFRYFFNCHTPHPFSKSRFEKFFTAHPDILEKNISYRFRNQKQYNLTTLANHLEIMDGNENFARLNLVYLHPYYSRMRLRRKIMRSENDPEIKSVCIQSLDMFSRQQQEEILGWMDKTLDVAAGGHQPG
jgi:hypothetical protein